MENNTPVIVKTNVSIPVTQQERIQIIDALRGFALCGILIMNIVFFGIPFMAVEDPRIMNELNEPANHFWWMFMKFFMEGSMRGLFSILFGAGTLLLLGRLEKRNAGLIPADIYFRRLLWLLIFGLINGFLLNWPGDILYHYAIVGMFIFPFRKASPKLLLGFITLFVLITMVMGFVKKRELFELRANGLSALQLKNEGKALSEEQEEALGAWEGFLKSTDTASNRMEFEKMKKSIGQGGYFDVMGEMSVWTVKLESIKFYGGMFFDVIIFFLAGIFLYKSGIITGEKSLLFYTLMAVAGYLIGFGEGYLKYRNVMAANFDIFAYYRNGGLPFDIYQIHRIGTSLGHLGLLMVLYKTGWFRWLLFPLSKLGQMAFTNYLGQSLICGLIFYGYGLAYYGKLERYELYYVWAGIMLFQIVFSIVWLRFFRFGPLEWVWRSLTYWKKQPIVKDNTVVEMP
ncbi:MAG: DUF418 domain-containing protein [Chitinophagaceae bacterium]|nr:DUF418 domain-containing protein [Chitinophagaceae bacterium]